MSSAPFLFLYGCRGKVAGSSVFFPDAASEKGHISQGGLQYSSPDCKFQDYWSNKIDLNVMLSLGLMRNN